MGQMSNSGGGAVSGKGGQQPPNPQLGAMQQMMARINQSGGAMTPPSASGTGTEAPPQSWGGSLGVMQAPSMDSRDGGMQMGGMDRSAVGLRDPNAGAGWGGGMTPMTGGPIASQPGTLNAMPGRMTAGMGMPTNVGRRIMPGPQGGPISPDKRMMIASLLRGGGRMTP